MPEVTLRGEAGEIVWAYESTYTVACPDHPVETRPVPPQLDVRLQVLDAVLDRLVSGHGFIVTPSLVCEHTRLVNALHEYFPIHGVPRRYLNPAIGARGVFYRVRNLDAVLALASKRGQLFSEAGAPWAQPSAGMRSLRGYRGWKQ